MQYSFEKQVQEKMDELQFVPSEPVWENIEKQIRSKKDRRRVVFWLPIVFLLLGGGAWWFAAQNNQIPSANLADKKTEEMKGGTIAPDRKITSTTASHKTQLELNKIHTEQKTSYSDEPSRNGQIENGSAHEKKAEKKYSELLSTSYSKKIKQQPSSASTLAIAPDIYNIQTKTKYIQEKTKKNPELKEKIPTEELKTNEKTEVVIPAIDSISYRAAPVKDSSNKLKVVTRSTDTTNAAIASVAESKKKRHSKWQFGFIAGAGMSGVGKDFKDFGSFSSFDQRRSYAAYDVISAAPGSIGNFSPAAPPSPVKAGFAYSLGIVASKKISNRFNVSTGFQYNQYNTKIKVGEMRRQDSVLQNNKSVDYFYLNTGTYGSEYNNRYHFITLPLSFDWKLISKLPLFIQGGVSIQQLLSTNALIYDLKSNIYYSDKDMINKTQLFSNIGLAYEFFNKSKTSLLIGPQLQYGWSKLENNNTNKHLFSLGITAQVLFLKK
jgi:hypothetical protein